MSNFQTWYTSEERVAYFPNMRIEEAEYVWNSAKLSAANDVAKLILDGRLEIK